MFLHPLFSMQNQIRTAGWTPAGLPGFPNHPSNPRLFLEALVRWRRSSLDRNGPSLAASTTVSAALVSHAFNGTQSRHQLAVYDLEPVRLRLVNIHRHKFIASGIHLLNDTSYPCRYPAPFLESVSYRAFRNHAYSTPVCSCPWHISS